MFEYGSRVGIWRVLRAFEKRSAPATAFACALALERLPDLAAAVRDGIARTTLDVCCHGYRWEDHIAMDEATERARIAAAVSSLTRTVGAPPRGWYCRTAPSIRTRRLLLEHGGFEYDSDAYNDDLPYWTTVQTADGVEHCHLVIPYTLCTNDSVRGRRIELQTWASRCLCSLLVDLAALLTSRARALVKQKFAPGRAFSTADDFYCFCRAAVDALLAEADETGIPRALSVGACFIG